MNTSARFIEIPPGGFNCGEFGDHRPGCSRAHRWPALADDPGAERLPADAHPASSTANDDCVPAVPGPGSVSTPAGKFFTWTPYCCQTRRDCAGVPVGHARSATAFVVGNSPRLRQFTEGRPMAGEVPVTAGTVNRDLIARYR